MGYIKEGAMAPAFTGKNQNGENISLEKFKGKKIILFFYPKDNTPGCTAEACNLGENYDELIAKGFEVIGVSPDGEASHQKFISKFSLPYNLIADTEKEILKTYGAWGLKKMYGKEYEGVLRTTYVIDEAGKVVKVFSKVNTKDHSNQILEAMDI